MSMPQLIGHWAAGQKLLSSIDIKNQNVLRENEGAFELGLIGPDVFYAHTAKDGKSFMPLLGYDIHKDSANKLLVPMQEYALSQGEVNHELLSYIAGYVSHYHLDKTAHPFVGSQIANGGNHNRIETDMEGAIYNHIVGQDVRNFKHGKQIPYENLEETARMISAVVKEVYGRNFTEQNIKTAMKNFYRFHRVVNNKIVSKLKNFSGLQNAFLLSYFKHGNVKNIDEIVEVFENTNRSQTSEIKNLMESMIDRKTYQVDDALGFLNGV